VIIGAGLVLSATAPLLPSAGPVRAQEPAPDSLPPVTVDTLVVQVLRTPVELGNVPFSVSTAGVETLRRGKAGVSLEEALQAVPGVQLQNRYNYSTGERVAVRGLGARAQFGVRGLKVLIDGIPATLPDGQSTLDHLDLGSLGRAEILRGPASALYGNASGGVLSFSTAPPPTTPFRPDVLIVGGSDGLFRLQGTAAGTAGATRYLANVAWLGYDGFRTNPLEPEGQPYSRAERLNVNGQLSWNVWGGRLGLTVNALRLDAENPGSLSDSLLAVGDREAFRFNVIQQTRKEVSQGQAGVSWEGPVGSLRGQITAYGITRTLDNPIPPVVIDLGRLAGGVRATLGSGSVRSEERAGWLVGADLELQRDDRLNYDNDGGERGEVVLDQLERVRGVGVFAQGGLGVGSRLRVVGALRYDRSSFEADDRLPARFPGQGLEDASGDRTMDALSPSVGISLDAGSGQTAFVSASSLFGTPTTTELANQPDGSRGFNQELDPQTGFTLEAGARGRLGGSAGYEIAFFRTQLEGELIPFESPDQPGRTFFQNAGSSRYRGVEASLFGSAGRGVSGRVTYTFTDAEFEDYVVDGEDLRGNKIPGQAPHRVEALLRIDQGRGYGELRYLFMDAIPVNDRNTASSDGYGLVDLRGGFADLALGRLVLSPFVGVNNLFDETYVASVVVNAFGGRFFEPGPTRTLYVGLSAGWPGG
jgi:iron complex outermembrane receptor protein